MSQQLIDHSPDLKRLRDEGFNIEVKEGFLLVYEVPYVNASSQIAFGILVSDLDLQSPDQTSKPKSHVIFFSGEFPCNKDGSPIKQIVHESNHKSLANDIEIDHSFSNKPRAEGYTDYYEKVQNYVNIISAPAKSLDSKVTANTFRVIKSDVEESPFNYYDTNSSRGQILSITGKLSGQKVGIIGLGGTGSYVLDFIAKTSVKEIHLYDGDLFLQHNAFRSPGAPSAEKLSERQYKVHYFDGIYSQMKKNIIAHPENLNTGNISELSEMDFVFICIDTCPIKKSILSLLIDQGIAFVDVGMGIHAVEDSLIGIIRTTASTKDARDHITGRISFVDDTQDEYSTNIQIAELNALNASLAVISWKKLYGYYQDLTHSFTSIYTINTGEINNED
ncbi:MAG: ThiF family adenylyltransferase [Anaerolineaceae bacterium]